MKKYNVLLILLSIFSMLSLTSCEKDKAPVFEIYVDANTSETLEYAEFEVNHIRFFESKSNGQCCAISNLQFYDGAPVKLDLDGSQDPVVIANQEHWSLDLNQIEILNSHFKAITKDGREIPLTVSDLKIDKGFFFEDNKTYKITIELNMEVDENDPNMVSINPDVIIETI